MKEKYIDDLKEIKDIMNRSSRFISLSGFAGVSAGVIALIGSYLAYRTVFQGQDYLVYHSVNLSGETLTQLLLIAIGTLVIAIGTIIFFTTREAKKQKQNIWDLQTKRLLINVFIPLATGGILCLVLLLKGFVGFLAPFSLIFYGLALLHGSKYTLNVVRSLGLIEILLGLIAAQFVGSGLIFWAIGFGALHIIYGLIFQWKN